MWTFPIILGGSPELYSCPHLTKQKRKEERERERDSARERALIIAVGYAGIPVFSILFTGLGGIPSLCTARLGFDIR